MTFTLSSTTKVKLNAEKRRNMIFLRKTLVHWVRIQTGKRRNLFFKKNIAACTGEWNAIMCLLVPPPSFIETTSISSVQAAIAEPALSEIAYYFILEQYGAALPVHIFHTLPCNSLLKKETLGITGGRNQSTFSYGHLLWFPAQRQISRMMAMNAYSRHKELINLYHLSYPGATNMMKRDTSKDRTDYDVLKDNHRFLWSEKDDASLASSWEARMARKYYDKLFKG
ncbi:hypothetical protein NECAME_14564 [Necator americanus]|uniref:Uncharacterized protein n=1 Tax=Necator americanus TaxID=51031 RepID=W2SPG8_NECAM|nr:hypothetical protein NECAME_14564 [Necator americanus]ETN70746.1 hypothetical protein NECAME_14564 [Necator americanus]